MMRFDYRLPVIATAILAGLGAPAAAADPAGYAIIGASNAKANYAYLTKEAVAKKVRPGIAAQLPADGRLIILNVNFRATGSTSKMVKLSPADLRVQWDGGAAPVLGAHISKDYWAMDGGFYTSMRPDKYELFTIVPSSATAVDLAQRQPDGSYKTVKARIVLPAPK